MSYTPNTWRPMDVITSKKLNDLEQGLTQTSDNVVYGMGGATQSSDGIHSLTYINKGDVLPNNPQVGDTIFMKDGDDFSILEWDGEQWNTRVDPKLSDRIQTALDEAKDNTQTLINNNNESINEMMDQVTKDKIAAALKDADFNAKAQAMADKALSDAKANTATVAQETLNSANQNLSTAKTDLTKSIANEASARNKEVAAANSQAQTYANQAKSDALNAVNKEASDRVAAVNALDTKAQTYANAAKNDALNTINQEVTDRQNAVSALNTKATNAVNQAKSDINATINALSIGGRNYILDTANPKTQTSNGTDNQDINIQAKFYSPIKNWGIANGDYIISFDWTLKTALSSDMQASVFFNGSPYQQQFYTVKSGQLTGHVDLKFKLASGILTANPDITGLRFRIMSQMASGNTITYSSLFMKSGTIATDWTAAPEDIVLDYTTKDNQIKATITQYQTTNDGKVTKAQTDATNALGQVATKVSQTDYDTKTGDLSTKYTQVKQTIDSQATDIVDIKKTATSQASKINSISSDVDGTKQSISDIEKTQDSQSDKINQITTDVNGTKQSISDIQTKDGNQDTRMGTIETSVSGVKNDFSSYKTTNDGAVKTAQTTAQTAFDGLKNKVSQTDYNTKTGQLQTDLTTTTQTANQAKTDIVSIKQKDGDQDARMTQIESDASGVKTTVSDLKTTQGKQSSNISTLQQRADGFDATVTKVDNLSTGDRNYILDTGNQKAQTSNGKDNQDMRGSAVFYSPIKNWGIANGDYIISFDWTLKMALSSDMQASVFFDQSPWQQQNFTVKSGQLTGHVDLKFKLWSAILTASQDVAGLTFRIMSQMASGNTITYSNLFMKSGTINTTWTPAPEDLSGATAKAQLTADQATLSINNYKTDSDGRISKAQADIKANANSITQKVSQTDYNTKTGQLQTDLNTTTTTANQAKTDIASIKSDNTKQDARMTTIENDANGTKTTVSNLQTDLGKANGSITTLQQRADGFDATVTKINTTVSSLGQINQLFNTEFSPDFQGWTAGSNPTNANPVTTEFTLMGTDGFGSNVVSHKGGGNWINSAPITVTAGMALSFSSRISVPKTSISGVPIALYIMAYNATNARVLSKGYNIPNNQLTSTPTTFKIENIVMPSGSVKAFAVYAWNVSDEVYISQPMLVFSDHVGTYVQGNYNNNSATAKAQLTADQATLSINNYKTDSDGRISKAQADIKANANSITQKVSQSDYDKKTGDLTSAVSKAQTTANGAVTTVGNYKTSNDARVKAAESKIEQNSKDITSKVSKTDYNQKTGELSGSISTLKQRADGFDSTVTKVNNLSVGGRNLYINATQVQGYVNGSNGTITPPNSTNKEMASDYIPVLPNTQYILQAWGSLISGQKYWSGIGQYDVNKVFLNRTAGIYSAPTVKSNVANDYEKTMFTTGANTYFVRVSSRTFGNYKIKFEQGNLPTDWTPAPEDTDNKISTVSQKVDSITSIVSDPNTGLSTRVQTAEGALSKVQGTDIPALQKATFWQPYSSLNFNDYTKQGSFFFNTTAAKTNGPTTSNAWLYLMVEQGRPGNTTGDTRVKQTAWYDGAGVKITYVRTLNAGTWSPWYANDNDSVTTISQTNSSIKQEIADRKTGDNNTLQSSKNFTTSSITSYDKGIQSTITQTASGILANISATNLFQNSEFNQDYGWRSKSGTVTYLANQNIDSQYHGIVRVVTTTTGYQGFWGKNIPVQGGAKYSGSVKVHFNNNGIAAGKALYDLWFVDKNGARISTGTGGSVHLITTMVSGPYWVDLWADGITAPINAVYAQVSLLVVGGSGMAADFTMPTFTATDVHQQYSPNDDVTTQLALLKDNWSIGINDNIGGIVSGIVGNSSQMSLISKKVVIDSPSTQITGKTWINSAMIANAAIQTVNIADAAITSAKIAKLDVAKLTGNVSSFIQSNWNGQFGSTTIDSTGMQVVTGKAKTKFGDGSMSIISSLGENIGWIGRQVDSVYHNLDYLTFGLNGWHTTTPGDDNYDDKGTNTDQYYGGDGIIFGISTIGGGYLPLLQWNSDLAAGYRGGRRGWMFTQPIVAGLTVYTENSNNDANGIIMQPATLNGVYYPALTSISSGGATGYAIGSGASYMYAGNNRILRADSNGYLYYQTTKTGSSGKSLLMASDGAIIAQSSATKYKTNIQYEKDTSFGDKLLTIDPATWSDKNEVEQIAEFNKTGKEPDYAMNKDGSRYYGLIAEDMVKAGLEELVVRDAITGAVEGIQYEKIGAALIPLLREQRNQINELKVEIERLKVKTSE